MVQFTRHGFIRLDRVREIVRSRYRTSDIFVPKNVIWLSIAILFLAFLGATLATTSGRQMLDSHFTVMLQQIRGEWAAWAGAAGSIGAAVIAVHLARRGDRVRAAEHEAERKERARVLAAILMPTLLVIAGSAAAADDAFEECLIKGDDLRTVNQGGPTILLYGLDSLKDCMPELHRIKHLGVYLADLYAQCVAANALLTRGSLDPASGDLKVVRDHLLGLERYASGLYEALSGVLHGVEEAIDYPAVGKLKPYFGYAREADV